MKVSVCRVFQALAPDYVLCEPCGCMHRPKVGWKNNGTLDLRRIEQRFLSLCSNLLDLARSIAQLLYKGAANSVEKED